MLYVGIRDEATEQVTSQLCDLKDEGYRQRTQLLASVTCCRTAPGARGRSRQATPRILPASSQHMPSATQSPGWLYRLSSDHTELLAAARHSPPYSQAMGACRGRRAARQTPRTRPGNRISTRAHGRPVDTKCRRGGAGTRDGCRFPRVVTVGLLR